MVPGLRGDGSSTAPRPRSASTVWSASRSTTRRRGARRATSRRVVRPGHRSRRGRRRRRSPATRLRRVPRTSAAMPRHRLLCSGVSLAGLAAFGLWPARQSEAAVVIGDCSAAAGGDGRERLRLNQRCTTSFCSTRLQRTALVDLLDADARTAGQYLMDDFGLFAGRLAHAVERWSFRTARRRAGELRPDSLGKARWRLGLRRHPLRTTLVGFDTEWSRPRRHASLRLRRRCAIAAFCDGGCDDKPRGRGRDGMRRGSHRMPTASRSIRSTAAWRAQACAAPLLLGRARHGRQPQLRDDDEPAWEMNGYQSRDPGSDGHYRD